jgi:hypothetical protein
VGRSIPSFRQLIEIERLNWSEFKKELTSKKDKEDKKAFDIIFENAILYCSYLSNANNSIPINSIIMGTLFHNYKICSELAMKKKNKTNTRETGKESSFKVTPTTKLDVFHHIRKKWSGLIRVMHKEDSKLIVEMIYQVSVYHKKDKSSQNIKNSNPNIDFEFYILALLNLQKSIIDLKENHSD